MRKKYAYLGPKGTYSEEVLIKSLGDKEYEAIPMNGIEDVLVAVSEGKVNYGMVPVENSIEGTVNQTLDGLIKYSNLKIVGEYYIPIKHSLMTKTNITKEQVCVVASHPQALAQCREYIKRNFPGVKIAEFPSTAQAMKFAAKSEDNIGVIGSANAASVYGLKILEEEIQDFEENITRFLLISKDSEPVSGLAKTTLMVSITDRPGALYEILKEFALANLSLTRIESRPAKKSFGDYVFFIDFLGNQDDPDVTSCLSAVEKNTVKFRILGVYKLCNGKTPRTFENRDLELEELREHINIIDYQIVELLSKRMKLVSKIGELKSCPQSVRDHQREYEIIQRLKTIAEKKDVDPYIIETIYRNIFDYSVALQEKQFRK